MATISLQIDSEVTVKYLPDMDMFQIILKNDALYVRGSSENINKLADSLKENNALSRTA